MDIHEYQAKKILSNFGIRIPRGGIAYSPENAEYKAREIGGSNGLLKLKFTPEQEVRPEELLSVMMSWKLLKQLINYLVKT